MMHICLISPNNLSWLVVTDFTFYRSLISRLEEIDPRKMTHEEKLAFWINVHNALVMHVRIYIKQLYNTLMLLTISIMS